MQPRINTPFSKKTHIKVFKLIAKSVTLVSISFTLLFSSIFMIGVHAEGVSTTIKISPSSPVLGETKEVRVEVGLSHKLMVTNYDAIVHFDPEYFQLSDKGNDNLAPSKQLFGYEKISNNKIKLTAMLDPKEESNRLFILSFIPIKEGSTSFQVTDTKIVDEYPASTRISVTINKPVPKSSENKLKSLAISPGSLSPAFSEDQLNYTVALGSGTNRLNVSAAAKDGKANVSGGGTVSLSEGQNTIRITVTAENGDKRTYTIIATRAAATPTPELTPTPEPSPTPEPTPTPEPIPTPPVMVDFDGKFFSVTEVPDGIDIPAGFYRSLVEMDGQMVPVYKSLRSELILYYLTRHSADDGFYYLDAQSGRFLPYLVLSVPAQSFTVLYPDETVTVPAGWVETSLTIDGRGLPAWRMANQEEAAYLLYLLAPDGSKAFYRYDTASQLLLPFAGELPDEPANQEPVETEPDDENPQEPVQADPAKPNPWTLATAIMGLVCLALVGALIWQGVRNGRYYDQDELPPPPPIKRL